MCRMGDIYHMIKNRVESLSKYKIKPIRSKVSPMSNRGANFKQQLKMLKTSDSEDSFQSIQKDEKLHEYAENLRESYKKDPKLAIC